MVEGVEPVVMGLKGGLGGVRRIGVVIEGENLLEQGGDGAAVEEDVMEGPYQPVVVGGDLNECKSLERAGGEVEGGGAVFFEKSGEDNRASFLPRGGEGGVQGSGFGGEGGAEDVVGGGEGFPSGPEARRVDGLGEGADHLLEIDAGGGVLEPREKHTLLKRGERDDFAAKGVGHLRRMLRWELKKVGAAVAEGGEGGAPCGGGVWRNGGAEEDRGRAGFSNEFAVGIDDRGPAFVVEIRIGSAAVHANDESLVFNSAGAEEDGFVLVAAVGPVGDDAEKIGSGGGGGAEEFREAKIVADQGGDGEAVPGEGVDLGAGGEGLGFAGGGEGVDFAVTAKKSAGGIEGEGFIGTGAVGELTGESS